MSSLSDLSKLILGTSVLKPRVAFVRLAAFAAVVHLAALPAYAQEDIESLFGGAEEAPSSAPIETAPLDPAAEQAAPAPESAPKESQKPQADIKSLTDLSSLETFKDVVVIQRRYLPKTGRFEFYGAFSMMLNDAFFNNFGLNGRVGYYFQERYGVEFVTWLLTNSERGVITDLREDKGVETNSFVSSKNYLGLDFKWAPIYGKMTWQNRKITPFDMYFSFGLGLMGTNQGKSEVALHLGTGQIFAKTKKLALRWDISWMMFNSTTNVAADSSASLYHNVLLQLGASWFYPEATYR